MADVISVEGTDGQVFEFPAGTSQDDMLKALQAHYGGPKEIGHLGGLTASATQGALLGFGDEYLAGLSSALGAQPDGQGGARWFDYSKPIKERYDVALNEIRREMGQYGEEHPNLATGAQIAGAVGTLGAGGAALPVRGAQAATRTGRAIQAVTPHAAKTVPGRTAQMAGGGAIGGAVEGFGAGEGGVGNRLKSAGIGAAVGAVFAPIVGYGASKVAQKAEQIGGRALKAIFRSRKLYNPETGELTGQGRARLQQLGFDAQQLSRQMQESLATSAERIDMGDDALTGVAVGRVAQADRFGVPLTRGQSTSNVPDVAQEEAMRAGVRGQGAYDTIDAFDRTQRNAIDAARQGIGDQVGEGTGHRLDAADSVIAGVRREADAARTGGRDAYNQLAESGTALGGEHFAPLARQIDAAVSSDGSRISDATPNAQAAMNRLSGTFDGAQRGAVPFQDVERTRQQMLRLQRAADRGSNGEDQIAIGHVVSEFDAFLDDTITDAIISGESGVLDQAKTARRLWANYRQTYLSRDGADNFIRKIVEDDLAPDQVAGWLYGASKNIGGGQSSLVAKRVKNILGEDSAEFAAVRRAAWDHITTPVEGQSLGPQAVASSISELLDGKGRTLGRVLFNDQERQMMGEFRNMLRLLEPPARATNRSGTGYENQRAVQAAMQGVAGLIGTNTGGPLTGVAAASAVKAGNSFSGTLQARAAAQGVVFPAASVPVAIGAGVGTGAALQEKYVR